MADGIALEAMRLVRENLVYAVRDGTDIAARTHMLMAAAMGATAFQKGLGVVHAWSHPLGGATGIHHGTANAVFLPYAMIANRAAIGGRMEGVARYLDLRGATGFEAVLDWMVALRRNLGLPHTLEEAGIDRSLGRKLVAAAAADPSMATNPRPLDEEELLDVFEAAWTGRMD
jgi:alcohol dehydrogenase class IV